MFGFLLGNKYLAIAKWIAIAGAVWYIFHTWDKAQNYDKEHAQLLAEISCSVDPPTACHLRALKAVDAGAKAVEQAVKEVQAQNDKAAQDREARAKADKESSDNAISKANHDLSLWQQKYQAQLAKDKSCAEWSVQPVMCSLQLTKKL